MKPQYRWWVVAVLLGLPLFFFDLDEKLNGTLATLSLVCAYIGWEDWSESRKGNSYNDQSG